MTASIKPSLIIDINELLTEFLLGHLISLKKLHTFVGKVNNVASLLAVLRPFLHPLWAALYSPEAGSPKGTIWTKQVRPTLLWLQAFFSGSASGIQRRFDLSAYLRQGVAIQIGTDASPYGRGGGISIDESIQHHFLCPVSADDQQVFQLKSGTSVGQQIWECLAMLVALRIWQTIWSQHRLNLTVKGDSIGALTLLLKMRPHSPRHAIIARELALVLIESPFFP